MGEFNVNKSDGSLDPTAGMPETYPAEQVMLSDGVTSVEDALDELSERVDAHIVNGNSRVTITDYTTANPYVCPGDGYIRLDITSGQKYVAVNGSNIIGGTFTDAISLALLVKKGMRIAPSTGSGTFALYFYPFE